jgi:hypothetical protein
MDDKVLVTGKIIFEPEDVTKKHETQSSWKHIAMVFIDGEITEYYSWFLKKRYNLILNKPLRGAHVSFINDNFRDMSLNGQRNYYDVKKIWNIVKNKWDGINVPLMLDLNPRTNSKHWWLNVHKDYRGTLHNIRNELGLGKPFYGLHMSIGYVNEKNISHSEYLHELVKSGLIE